MTRYIVNKLDNITNVFPEHEARLWASEAIASDTPEFWRARVFDMDTLEQLPQTIDIIISRDPFNGDWIGIANGGNYEWAEEAFFGPVGPRETIALAVESYMNDFDAFAACK